MKAKMVDVQELLSDDLELLLREIDEFCAASAKGIEQDIPETIENYLLYVANTGNTIFPWENIRPLFRLKLKNAIAQFQGEPSSIEPYVFERFDLFRSAPFTIQRLSELITSPNRHYKIKDKFVSALEKTVFVVSTVEPKLPNDNDNFTNGSEENNTSSSDDGLTHEMNITFDSIQPSDYNNSIGIELSSMSSVSSSNSENEALKVDADSLGDVVATSESRDPSASGDNAGTMTGPTSETNGFTMMSESAVLIQDPLSFQNVQQNAFNHSDGGELSEQVSSLLTAVAPSEPESDVALVDTSNDQPTSDTCALEQTHQVSSDPIPEQTPATDQDQTPEEVAESDPAAMETDTTGLEPQSASSEEPEQTTEPPAISEPSNNTESVTIQDASVPESIDSTS